MSEILREFSAKYLPQLVEAFNESGDTAHSTVYSDVLRAVSRNMYWGRFQKETELGQSVILTHARRLAKYDGRIAADQAHFGQSAMFLWQLLAWEDRYDPHPLPQDHAKKIVRMIKEFRRDCPGAIGTSIGQDAMIVLEGPGPRLEEAKFRIDIQRSQWKMDIIMCHCGASHPPGKVASPLLRCSLCKTVAYCSAAHQKVDWKSHKKRCFKPSWEVSSHPTPVPGPGRPTASQPQASNHWQAQEAPQRQSTLPGMTDLAQDID